MNPYKDYFEITGFGGQKKIKGKISVNGSKNAVLPAMAMALLFSTPLRLMNVPGSEDVKRLAELMKNLGIKVARKSDELKIDASKIIKTELERDISKRLRASIVLSGPVLARLGEVSFPHPGGCVIGERPIDLFLEGFRKMGATVKEDRDTYRVTAKHERLTGADIVFNQQSVTATETFMLAAALAKGITTLRNVSMEPEITSLAEFLREAGVKIGGIGTPVLTIDGGEGGRLLSTDKVYRVIPDRIEAGSFLMLGAIVASELQIENCDPEHLAVPIEILRSSGADIKTTAKSIIVKAVPQGLCRTLAVKTHEYPGFPTDLQAPLAVFMSQCCMEGQIFETIFDGRLNYTADLIKMGADITMWDAHRVTIKGPTELRGKEVEGPDIRAGIAFIIAAIVAEGQSIIRNAYFVDRGYEQIEKRLWKIGVNIRRVKA